MCNCDPYNPCCTQSCTCCCQQAHPRTISSSNGDMSLVSVKSSQCKDKLNQLNKRLNTLSKIQEDRESKDIRDKIISDAKKEAEKITTRAEKANQEELMMNKRELEAVYQNEFNKAMKELNKRQQQAAQEQQTVQQEDEIEDIDTTGGNFGGALMTSGSFTMMAASGGIFG